MDPKWKEAFENVPRALGRGEGLVLLWIMGFVAIMIGVVGLFEIVTSTSLGTDSTIPILFGWGYGALLIIGTYMVLKAKGIMKENRTLRRGKLPAGF